MAEDISTGQAMGCLGKAHGLLTVLVAVLEAVAGLVVLGILGRMVDKNDLAVRAEAVWLLERPWMVAVLAIPAVAVGIHAMTARRPGLWLIFVESFLLLAPFAAILLTFLAVIAPLYEFEPI